ncbi:P-loop containing nucleoside triphosphate hydrolase protein [Glonium stellatum]|uniref:P-loop containing nucleoside triphosphate hydrolase protein n=1 Tax=Glonium stellatum TaxID=574774 RepID=A0A8E2FAB8_9PEZI|nr:P-loop containing nucleoside triphosphate hydrolase protein [Glonium stellatum]
MYAPWDNATSKYKIVESSTVPSEVDAYDEYIFVVRIRIDKKTERITHFIDVKSKGLRDILRSVLQGVEGTFLKEDKPSVERNLLYHFLPELEAYKGAPENSTHLDLLVNYIRDAYTSTKQRLVSLQDSGEITFDLLWTLFKPNELVYGKCFGTDKRRCIRFNLGGVKEDDKGDEYFRVEGQYLDFDGKNFGEAATAAGISTFQGSKPIHSLGYFPLKYHPNAEEEKQELANRGRKFISLIGTHHRQYEGKAFYMEKGKPTKLSVDGRIIVDPALFREYNPNYTKPSIDELRKHTNSDMYAFNFSKPGEKKLNEVKSNGKEPAELKNDDLLICSPTVLGFSLNYKFWLEFAVDNISDIKWNPLSFQNLAIPEDRKKLVRALAASHAKKAQFDDFVPGKGRGLIMLLHGPTGVGKTLTAEGLSEELQRPLYTLSSGDLATDPKQVEFELSRAFRQANCWDTILLLDEADVFIKQQSLSHTDNNLITIFLRKLKYYKGIIILTTNRVKDFNGAMLSRIRVAIRYLPLGVDTRRTLWTCFLGKAITTSRARFSSDEIEELARRELNGRQIKNAVGAALALACEDKKPLSSWYLEIVLQLGDEFDNDLGSLGQVGNRSVYC